MTTIDEMDPMKMETVELEFSKEDLLFYMTEAHKMNITFNEYINKALAEMVNEIGITSKITYSTNWMGPVNVDWINEHGDHWAGGRIDIYGPWDYPREYSLPMMHVEDYGKFSDWLDTLQTDLVLSFDGIITMYEESCGGSKIRWHKDVSNNS